MDLILATIGLGLLVSGASTGKLMIDGSPLYFSPWVEKLFYVGAVLSFLSLISGFFFFGAWWLVSIVVAWLPLNYLFGKPFSNPAHRAFGVIVSNSAGSILFVAGMALAA